MYKTPPSADADTEIPLLKTRIWHVLPIKLAVGQNIASKLRLLPGTSSFSHLVTSRSIHLHFFEILSLLSTVLVLHNVGINWARGVKQATACNHKQVSMVMKGLQNINRHQKSVIVHRYIELEYLWSD